MAGINFSSFFGNSNSSGLNSLNLGDYNLIKNGSYQKLMKSYYANQNAVTKVKSSASSKQTENTKASSSKTSNASKVYKKSTDLSASTPTTKIKTEADELKASAEKLNSSDLWKQKNGAYDTDEIAKAVKSFADDYNDVIAQNEKVGTKSVTNQTQYMKNTSNTMAKALEKVGVSFDTDGKMSVDTDKLKKADTKDLRAAFYGSYSYSSQIASNAAAISSAAARSSATYGSDGSLSNYMNFSYEQWT